MANIEMVIDSIRADMMAIDKRVVILTEKAGKRYLVIGMNAAQADMIEIKRGDIAVPRPLLHDILCTVIEMFGGKVSMAIIDELREDIFEAKLVLDAGNKRFVVDCRPCDAIAVALTAKAPICAAEPVLDKAGISLNNEGKQNWKPEGGLRRFASRIFGYFR